MKLGLEAGGAPTSKSEARIVWVVPAMPVFATLAAQFPVLLVLEGLGAKHDWPFSCSTAEANAPDERS